MHTHKLSKIYRCDVHTLCVVVWTVGLIAGIYAGASIGEVLSGAIYHSCLIKNSFFIPAAILPITLVFVAAKYSLHGMIYPVLFFKAFLDGVVFLSLGGSFGSAAWLMGIPALFSDRVSTVLLLYYSVRCLEDRSYRFAFWYVALFVVTIVAILLDHYWISEYLIFGMM